MTKEILALEAMRKDLLVKTGIEPTISPFSEPGRLGNTLLHDRWMLTMKFFKGFIIFIIEFFFTLIIFLDIGVIMIVIFQPSVSL
jgi:hypothetical protein